MYAGVQALSFLIVQKESEASNSVLDWDPFLENGGQKNKAQSVTEACR
jgi:hypothetical protein